MKTFSIVALFFLSLVNVFGQKEDYIWVNGTQSNADGSNKGFIIDFSQSPIQVTNRNLPVKFFRCFASMCDSKGDLLFYTNARLVIDKNHNLMPNGNGINEGEWADKYWPKEVSGYPGFQDILILSDPKFGNGYYVIHKPNIYVQNSESHRELFYSYVDMKLNDGLGDITIKNQNVNYPQKKMLTAYLTAIKHKNQKDWWIIQPIVEDSVFLTFHLDETGFHRMPDQNTHQYFNQYRSSAAGTARFSPDGTKYALYNYFDQLHVYDFDRETGILSNHQQVDIYHPDSIDHESYNFGSVEWSPNSRFIYAASEEKLHQVDTHASSLQDGVSLVATYNGAKDPFPSIFSFMVLGPDCKIYITPASGSYSLHVINAPDSLGMACDFVTNAIKLPNSNSGALPNFPRLRVDDEKKCDPTISSVFGEEVHYARPLHIFPNPATDHFTFDIPPTVTNGHLAISSLDGKLVRHYDVNASAPNHQIDISGLPAGIYIVDLWSKSPDDKVFYTDKLVKQ